MEKIDTKSVKIMVRPSWNEYFMQIAKDASTRSTCLRRQHGAVIVRNNQVVSVGYNGSPKRMPHCEYLGCLREELGIPSGERYELCRSVHAEANALIQAAKNGVSIDGSTMYVTGMPCLMCAKMIINAGIREVWVGTLGEASVEVQRMFDMACIEGGIVC